MTTDKPGADEHRFMFDVIGYCCSGCAWTQRHGAPTDAEAAHTAAHRDDTGVRLTDAELADLRAAAEAATPGPWQSTRCVLRRGGTAVVVAQQDGKFVLANPQADARMEDAAHMAAFDPPTVLALLDEVTAARASTAQDEALTCYDCGLLYGSPGWCDCKIPDDVWLRISPTGHEGGVLCITCIARRLVETGIEGVPLLITSGPWDWTAQDEAGEAETLRALLQRVLTEKRIRHDHAYPMEIGEHHCDGCDLIADLRAALDQTKDGGS